MSLALPPRRWRAVPPAAVLPEAAVVVAGRRPALLPREDAK